MEKQEWVESLVADRAEMPAHNKSVYRAMLRKEWDFWEHEAVREDSNSVIQP